MSSQSNPIRLLPPVIAIDGPAASGKGTIAQAIAEALNWYLLDSGLLYRFTAFFALENGLISDASKLAKALRATLINVIDTTNVDSAVYKDGITFVTARGLASTTSCYYKGQDITQVLRTERISEESSKFAELGPVREVLIEVQRRFRRMPGLVADGRDMASVVFKDAGLKLFVTASEAVRAKRRYDQLQGGTTSLDRVQAAISERDERDRARKGAPLVQVPDAMLLDTSDLTLEKTIEQALDLVRSFQPTAISA